jgi:putative endonuclease
MKMKNSCYILYSNQLGKFYIGYTSIGADERLERHLSDHYGYTRFTHKANDWVLFLEIECQSSEQAKAIETHIKKMKSKTFIYNLKKYPEMVEKILTRFSSDNSPN